MTKVKVLMFLTLSGLIASMVGLKDYQNYSSLYFVIEMDSSAKGVSQIFFDRGQGERERDSSRLQIRNHIFQKYYFPIPSTIKSLRFDPINKDAELRIKNAGIENGVGNKLTEFPINSFRARHEISKMHAVDDELEVITTDKATDPILIINSSSFEHESSWMGYLVERGWVFASYALLIFSIFIVLGIFWNYAKKFTLINRSPGQPVKNSTALLVTYIFYGVMTAHALLIYQQFSWLEVISVSLLFLLFLHVLLYVFHSKIFHQFFLMSLYDLLIAGLAVLFLMLLVGSIYLFYVATNDDPNIAIRAFNLLEFELGLGWNKDTAFHVALIQSILNFGYPSVAQHGFPMTVYHVLSHYADAFVILLTNVEPYDSYGLLFHFKIFLLLSSIVIFIERLINNKKPIFFLFALILISPIILINGQPLTSHSLSFFYPILLLSAFKVFRIISKSHENNLRDILFLSCIVFVNALGKITFGFMYAALLGFYLLFKQPKSYVPYLFGITTLSFFYFYSSLIPIETSVSFSGFSLSSFYDFLLAKIRWSTTYNSSIYAVILMLIFGSFIFKSAVNNRLLMAAISCVILVYIVTTMIATLGSDVAYFGIGLFSILILVTLHSFSFSLENSKRRQMTFLNNLIRNNRVILMPMIIISLFLTTQTRSNILNIFSISPKNVTTTLNNLSVGPFLNINRSEQFNEEIGFSTGFPLDSERSWITFREDLRSFLADHNLKKHEALLFIPAEMFKQNHYGNPASWNPPWARGMLIYAITGIPLVHGIGCMDNGFGFYSYDNNALWRSENNFDAAASCNVDKVKGVIVVQDFDFSEFELYRCNR